jgi:hypothetical protein
LSFIFYFLGALGALIWAIGIRAFDPKNQYGVSVPKAGGGFVDLFL